MDKGLYSASSGGLLATKRLDVVANNLANVNTVGFKAEKLISRKQEFTDTLASKIAVNSSQSEIFEQTPGVVAVGSATDFTLGPIQYTGDPLHVALRKENQFIAINTAEGEQLTRAGNFSKNAQGQLITADGFPVSGDGGPITIPAGNAKINPSGVVTVNGQAISKVRVVEVTDLSQLERVGATRFRLSGGGADAADRPDLAPESVEMPNTPVVEGMVEMIAAHKAFEAYTKSAKTIDELNERAIRTARSTG